MTYFCISYTSCQLNITTSTVKLLFYWAYLMTYKAVYGTYPIYVVFCTSPCFVHLRVMTSPCYDIVLIPRYILNYFVLCHILLY